MNVQSVVNFALSGNDAAVAGSEVLEDGNAEGAPECVAIAIAQRAFLAARENHEGELQAGYLELAPKFAVGQ